MESEARQNPLSKDKTIEQLQTTIQKLETIIEQLNSTSIVDLPSANSVTTLLTTTEELESTIAGLSKESVVTEVPLDSNNIITEPEVKESIVTEVPLDSNNIIAEAETVGVTPKSVQEINPASSSQSPIKTSTKVVNKSRKLKQKKTWIPLLVIALLIAIIPVSLKYLLPTSTQQLVSQKIEKVITKGKSLIATRLPQENQAPVIANKEKETLEIPIIEPSITDSSTLIIPPIESLEASSEQEQNTENSLEKSLETVQEIPSESLVETTPNPEAIVIIPPETEIEVPLNLIAEGREQPVQLRTVIQDVKLTPEQVLIAALESQITKLATQYQQDLILSIEPNSTDSILTVTISDSWYQLPTTEQDKIANQMLEKTQTMNFNKLVIKDNNHNLVARSPVVGQTIVILRRNS